MLGSIHKFLKLESASGILLMLATVLALLAANSFLQSYYDRLLSTQVVVSIDSFAIAKPLLLWINDGLMALFFLLVGLELKREAVEGELNSLAKVSLPAIAALGGMLVPALIYAAMNKHDPIALQGWAIPTATDIAFALGVLTLLGDKVPSSLKIFLVSLAIFDDIGAIIIIAIFYTDNLSFGALITALAGILILWQMNRSGVLNKVPYLLVGLIIWVGLLKSGVHATLAGIALAMFIPMQGTTESGKVVTPLHDLEEDLHAPVAFFVLPVFAFANAGLSLAGLTFADLFSPVPLGILLGLFVGKQLGVMLFVWLGVKLKLGKLADGVSWSQVYGVALLCGIGFTLSLFIGSLAFENVPHDFLVHDRLGILAGSAVSAVTAYIWLRFVAKPKQD